ncbi:MAG: sensor histidine kinase [Mucilaginibacter sp.]
MSAPLIQEDSVGTAVLLTGVFFAFLASSVIYFVVLYRNKQLKNKQEQDEREASFRQELLKTQLEVQEQTLEHISREIHDNITQVLSFVKLTLASVKNAADDTRQMKINESRELISRAITDLRDLSKSLSYEHINSIGLVPTIEKETERINKSGLIGISFAVEGERYSLGEQRELVLFRIFQEALNNALKHANARQFEINLKYHHDFFNLSLKDDGSGFFTEQLESKSGSGLRNMKNRAALIGGEAVVDSSPGKGCCVEIRLDPKQQFYTDGQPHPNRIG